jgi:hypothetical protein
MDKLNLMKAVLTLYLSAVAAIFLFRPTIKEYLPAKVDGQNVCILSNPVRSEKIMAHFLLIENNRIKLQPTHENCFAPVTTIPSMEKIKTKVLLVREGRSLWTALTKK